MRRIVVRKFKDGYFRDGAGNTADYEVSDPLDASDYSSCALYRDASASGRFELVEFELQVQPTNRSPVFADSPVDDLKAFVMGSEYGQAADCSDQFAWASNPFNKSNPAHDAWYKGFWYGMARNPKNSKSDPHYMGQIDDFIYPIG